jgi:hypothetical protein
MSWRHRNVSLKMKRKLETEFATRGSTRNAKTGNGRRHQCITAGQQAMHMRRPMRVMAACLMT